MSTEDDSGNETDAGARDGAGMDTLDDDGKSTIVLEAATVPDRARQRGSGASTHSSMPELERSPSTVPQAGQRPAPLLETDEQPRRQGSGKGAARKAKTEAKAKPEPVDDAQPEFKAQTHRPPRGGYPVPAPTKPDPDDDSVREPSNKRRRPAEFKVPEASTVPQSTKELLKKIMLAITEAMEQRRSQAKVFQEVGDLANVFVATEGMQRMIPTLQLGDNLKSAMIGAITAIMNGVADEKLTAFLNNFGMGDVASLLNEQVVATVVARTLQSKSLAEAEKAKRHLAQANAKIEALEQELVEWGDENRLLAGEVAELESEIDRLKSTPVVKKEPAVTQETSALAASGALADELRRQNAQLTKQLRDAARDLSVSSNALQQAEGRALDQSQALTAKELEVSRLEAAVKTAIHTHAVESETQRAAIRELSTKIEEVSPGYLDSQSIASGGGGGKQVMLYDEMSSAKTNLEAAIKRAVKVEQAMVDMQIAAAESKELAKVTPPLDDLKNGIEHERWQQFVVLRKDAVLDLIKKLQGDSSQLQKQLDTTKQNLLKSPRDEKTPLQVFPISHLPSGVDMARAAVGTADTSSTELTLWSPTASSMAVDPFELLSAYKQNIRAAIDIVAAARQDDQRVADSRASKLISEAEAAKKGLDEQSRAAMHAQKAQAAAEAVAATAAREKKQALDKAALAEQKAAAEKKNADEEQEKARQAAEKAAADVARLEEKARAAELEKKKIGNNLAELTADAAASIPIKELQAAIERAQGAESKENDGLEALKFVLVDAQRTQSSAKPSKDDQERFASTIVTKWKEEHTALVAYQDATTITRAENEAAQLRLSQADLQIRGLAHAYKVAVTGWTTTLHQLQTQKGLYLEMMRRVKQLGLTSQNKHVIVPAVGLSLGQRAAHDVYASWELQKLKQADKSAQIEFDVDALIDGVGKLKIESDSPNKISTNLQGYLNAIAANATGQSMKLKADQAARLGAPPPKSGQLLLQAPLRLAIEGIKELTLYEGAPEIKVDDKQGVVVPALVSGKKSQLHRYSLEAVFTPRADLGVIASSATCCWLECDEWTLSDIVARSHLRGGEGDRLKFGRLLTDVPEAFVLRTRVLPVAAVLAGLCSSRNDALLKKIGMPSPGKFGGATALLQFFAMSHASAHMLHAQRFAAAAFPDVREGRINLDDAVAPSVLRQTEALLECESAAMEAMIMRATYDRTGDADDLLASCLYLAVVATNMACYIVEDADSFGYVPMLCQKWQKVFAKWCALVREKPASFEKWEVELATERRGRWELEDTNQAVLSVLAMFALCESVKST